MSAPVKTTSPSPATQDRLKNLIHLPDIQKRFTEVMGKNAPAFLSSVMSAVATNPALKQCDPMSVISSAMIAATLDLPINSSLGLAYIVPFKGSAQLQIGWKGLVNLALRSGQYRTINATPVLEGQLVNRNSFTGEMLFQEEAISDKPIGYLLYFKLLNGYEKYFYMTREECERHGKKFSQTYKKGFGVWSDNFDAMALKTVVKLGLSKYGPLSIAMQKAIESDQGVFKDIDATPTYPENEQQEPSNAVTAEQVKAKASRLEKIIAPTTENDFDPRGEMKDDFNK